ncbi:unnamed protein product [Eruca vesicaria subsp. sativa]|uniref:Uncharacterized protein n=1 Tax=Eruca vesicaria subsp. sativa TaxID=29727 RepID=A0ABC8LJN7_ERUVS|nr:unnamed protein product [Eruca vesicaria subsp. sativa]
MEKIQHQKVRVRHMVMKPMEDRYPKWPNDKMDNERENLIKDIINGQLDEQFWDVTPTTNSPKKRKISVAASVIPNVSPSTKRQKGKEPAHGGETSDMVCFRIFLILCDTNTFFMMSLTWFVCGIQFAAQNVAILGLVDSISKLTEKIEGMDVSVAEKVTKSLEGTIQDKVDATMGPIKDELLKKIASLEKDVKFFKNKADVNIPQGVADSNSENSKANEDDASSNDLSWKIEKKISSLDGLPIQSVVKKEKKAKKTMEKEELKGEEDAVPLKKVKKEKKDTVRLKPVKKEKEDGRLKKVKKEKKAIDIRQLKDESILSQEWEDHLKWEKTEQCRQMLEELAGSLEKSTRRRKPQLTKTQVCPYVGSSMVKRIISDSKKAYDPLAKVESGKLQKLLDFIKQDLDSEEISYGDSSGQFYLVPREVWPTPDYGWLGDGHMAAALLMYHRRSMLSTSPYATSRIA